MDEITRSYSEDAFRNVWHTVAKQTGMPPGARIQHLKASLRSWVAVQHAKQEYALTPEGLSLAMDTSKGTFSQLEHLVSDAIRQDWPLEKLVSSICVAAFADAGLRL